jgi:hypothetical protein
MWENIDVLFVVVVVVVVAAAAVVAPLTRRVESDA